MGRNDKLLENETFLIISFTSEEKFDVSKIFVDIYKFLLLIKDQNMKVRKMLKILFMQNYCLEINLHLLEITWGIFTWLSTDHKLEAFLHIFERYWM